MCGGRCFRCDQCGKLYITAPGKPAENQDPERAFLLRVSYIEIYNETLRDLLNFKKGPLRDEEKPNIHFNKVCPSSCNSHGADTIRAKSMLIPSSRRSFLPHRMSSTCWRREILSEKLDKRTG